MLDDLNNEIDDELLAGFLDDSFVVTENLKDLLGKFKAVEDVAIFEQFGQQVDRVMGAAYTLCLNDLGDLTKLGKELGYKASQVNEIAKLLVIQSLLSQLVRMVDKMLKSYDKKEQFDSTESKLLLKRLTEASDQLGDLRTTVKI